MLSNLKKKLRFHPHNRNPLKRRTIFVLLLIFIFGWLIYSRIPQETQSAQASNNSIEKIKIKFDASSLTTAYKMRGASFQKIIKTDKAEKTEI